MPLYTPAYLAQLADAGVTVDRSVQAYHESSLKSDPSNLKPYRRNDHVCFFSTGYKHRSLYNVYKQSLATGKLGKGGFGVIKKHLASTGETFVMKIVRLETRLIREDFDAEIEVLKALGRHMGSGIIEKTNDDDKGYIAMPFYEGCTLRKCIDDNQLTTDQSISMFILMLKEVKTLHDLGYLHNDIKPTNFMVNLKDPNHPEIKIIDFGASRLIGKATPTITDHYTAPEMDIYTPRTIADDMYSLGITFLDVLSKCDTQDERIIRLKNTAEKMSEGIRDHRPTLDNVLSEIGKLEVSQNNKLVVT